MTGDGTEHMRADRATPKRKGRADSVESRSPVRPHFVVAWSGASGICYGVRLVEALLRGGAAVRLTISPAAAVVLRQEMGISISLDRFDPDQLPTLRAARQTTGAGPLYYDHFDDFTAPSASGSYRTDGMVICPCSMSTLGAIASGAGRDLSHRAAEVHLKERRPLVLVPRETPLSLIALRNMTELVEAGAVILPASPGFYGSQTTVETLIDFVVGRICDQLHFPNSLAPRWTHPIA